MNVTAIKQQIPLQLAVGWHFAAASLFVFLSTLLATMGMRGYAPGLSYFLAALFFGAMCLGASAGYGLSHGKRWATVASHTLTAFIGVGSLALLTLPFYAAEIAPRACVPAFAVLGLTAVAFLVSGHLYVSARPTEVER